MASRRQATAGAIGEAIDALERRKSVVCGFVVALTTQPKSDEVQCIAAPHGPVWEHGAGLASVLRDIADDLSRSARGTQGPTVLGSASRVVSDQKADVLLKRLTRGDLETIDRDADAFWLGRLTALDDDESRMTVNLLLEGQLTLAEARDGEAIGGIRMVTHLQKLDGATETPSSALAIWRKLDETARRLLVEKYEAEIKGS